MKGRCDLHSADDAAECLRRVAEYAATHPDRPWVDGEGWLMSSFASGIPPASLLDGVVPDRPVYLESRDGHSAWVNSVALEMAGIDASTPDPPRGRIERSTSGAPVGTLQEAAMELVGRLVPKPTVAEWEEAILLAQADLHALGITAWQDASVTPDILAAYRSLADGGALTARVVASQRWDPERGGEQVAEFADRGAWATGGWLRATTVKIFQDGVFESFTAAMLEPYRNANGHPTDHRGMSMVEAGALRARVTELDRAGLQVHVHAIGNRAVREALDAFEAAAAANGTRDARHHIAHLQFVDPRDIPRFAPLGVVANAQPFWACMDDYQRTLTIPFLSSELVATEYPFASLLRSGARLAFGSDWTVSTANPLLIMEVAVTRVEPDHRDGEPFLLDERLSLDQALTAYTRGSAFVNHLDAETGSLEPGKAADLVVLDRDLFASNARPIGDARVLLTVADGRPVFQDPSLPG